MTVPAVRPQRIYGVWTAGAVLDVHTIRSTHIGVNELGHDIYETERSEIGELLYRLKFRGDVSAVDLIVSAAERFLRPRLRSFDLIVPVPPSGERKVQPVALLAREIGRVLGVGVNSCVRLTRPPSELKGVVEPATRRELLHGLHAVEPKCVWDRDVLLFDDLYRSGATMNAIARLLLDEGGASSVRAFAITRTRSHR